MERLRFTNVLCAFLFLAPIFAVAMPVNAELAGNVAFSTEGLSMSPSTAVEGGDVTFTLSLQNVANVVAEDVVVEFHKNSYQSGNPSSQYNVDIPASDFTDIDFDWINLAWGNAEQTLVIRVTHNGESKIISHDFDIQGLPNLRFSHFEIDPSTGAHEGDQIEIQIGIENAGHAEAPSSHLELTFAGTATMLSVPSLQVGETAWVNQTASAPSAGNYDVTGVVNANISDDILESTSADNSALRVLDVESLPDYWHADGPHVTANPGLAGPWTITGTIARDSGSGSTTAPLEVRIKDGITLEIVSLSFTEVDTFAEYSVSITSSQLTDTSPGDVELEMEIDSSENLEQSNPFNNLQTTSLTIYQEPNVVVRGVSVDPDETTPGNMVTFTVSLQNVGMVTAIGELTATFDGQFLETKSLSLPPSNTANQGQISATFTSIVEGETRDIPFTVTWSKNEASYDRLETDNIGFANVSLISDLRLRFLQNTEGWLPAGPPLYAGNEYAYVIDVEATSGAGSEIFDCIDRSTGDVLDSTNTLSFSANEPENKKQTVRCEINAELPGEIELAITPRGTSVSPHAKAWTIELENGKDASDDSESSSIALFLIAGIIALVTLVGAIYLTRRGLADADRETYELCPACDGEIEGNEDICPYCDFDLRVGRSKFHDCEECKSTIPSMLEHCPYCGTEQDLSIHYSRRKRKYQALPETVEEEVVEEEDEDMIVRGHESFDSHTGEMGFTEEQWEGEWDDNLSEAEAYFDAQEEERIAAENVAETEADTDGDEVVSTELSEAMEDAPEHDLDAFLGDVESRKHLSDEEVELTASDADFREQIFEITGEDGVLPGQQVNVEAMVDNTVVGNEVRSANSDFTIGEESTPPEKPTPEDGKDETSSPKRRSVRRRKKDE